MNKCNRCGKEAHHDHHKDHNHKNNDPSNKENLCTLCHGEEHGISPKVSELRFHLLHYEKVQKLRIMMGNGISSYSRIDLIVPEVLWDKLTDLEKLEKECSEAVVDAMKNGCPHKEVRDWLLSIKGISHLLAAKLLAVLDPDKMPTVASLWHYAGYAPDDVRKRGTKSAWNQGLKKAVYQIGDSFIKQRTPKYREVYDIEKARQLEIVKGLHPKGIGIKAHADMRARRKMVKEFLKDLWIEWNSHKGGK